MSNLIRMMVGLTIAGVAAGCASAMTAGSYVRPQLTVAAYHSFAWGPADALPTGDARLDDNAQFRDTFEGAVEKALAARGFVHADTAPDLYLHYHASIDRRIDVDRTERAYGYCHGSGCDPWVIEYEAGTIVLDVIDARTQELIWRGWAQDSVEPILSRRDRLVEKAREAVGRMMASFPAR